jgi:hypothetical protein
MRETESQGTGKDRANCMRQFNGHGIDSAPARLADFTADPARLTEFLQMKRKRLR